MVGLAMWITHAVINHQNQEQNHGKLDLQPTRMENHGPSIQSLWKYVHSATVSGFYMARYLTWGETLAIWAPTWPSQNISRSSYQDGCITVESLWILGIVQSQNLLINQRTIYEWVMGVEPMSIHLQNIITKGLSYPISNSPSVSKTHGSFPGKWIGFIGDSHLMGHA